MCTDFALLGGRYMAACVEVRICSVCALHYCTSQCTVAEHYVMLLLEHRNVTLPS